MQVTYEGLLDDIFEIKCGVVEFGPEVTGTEKSVKTILNSDDAVFQQIRNRLVLPVATPPFQNILLTPLGLA